MTTFIFIKGGCVECVLDENGKDVADACILDFDTDGVCPVCQFEIGEREICPTCGYNAGIGTAQEAVRAALEEQKKINAAQEVSLISSGFEWVCPHCEETNSETAFLYRVVCQNCGKEFKPSYPL